MPQAEAKPKKTSSKPEIPRIEDRFPSKPGHMRKIIHLFNGKPSEDFKAAYRINYHQESTHYVSKSHFILVSDSTEESDGIVEIHDVVKEK